MREEQEPRAEVDMDGWLNVDYTFDPSTYHRDDHSSEPVVSKASPELWEPYSGRKRLLEAHQIDDGIEIHVPFEDSPGVLLVWPGEQGGRYEMWKRQVKPEASERSMVLPDTWKEAI